MIGLARHLRVVDGVPTTSMGALLFAPWRCQLKKFIGYLVLAAAVVAMFCGEWNCLTVEAPTVWELNPDKVAALEARLDEETEHLSAHTIVRTGEDQRDPDTTIRPRPYDPVEDGSFAVVRTATGRTDYFALALVRVDGNRATVRLCGSSKEVIERYASEHGLTLYSEDTFKRPDGWFKLGTGSKVARKNSSP